MKIAEITDYSMVIMKDSEDKPWLSMSDILKRFGESNFVYAARKTDLDAYSRLHPIFKVKDIVGCGMTIVLYFDEKVTDTFVKGDKVNILIENIVFGN